MNLTELLEQTHLFPWKIRWISTWTTPMRTICYGCSFFPSGSVGTCDEWRGTTASRSRLVAVLLVQRRALGCPAFSPLNGRGNVVLVRGSGPYFQTVTSSPATLFPRREATERKRLDLTDEGRAWKPTSPLTDSNFNSPTALHEKKPIQKSVHTHTYTHTETEIKTTNTGLHLYANNTHTHIQH